MFEYQSTTGRGFPSFVLSARRFFSLFRRQYFYILLTRNFVEVRLSFQRFDINTEMTGPKWKSLEQFPKCWNQNGCEQFIKADWPSTKSEKNQQRTIYLIQASGFQEMGHISELSAISTRQKSFGIGVITSTMLRFSPPTLSLFKSESQDALWVNFLTKLTR